MTNLLWYYDHSNTMLQSFLHLTSPKVESIECDYTLEIIHNLEGTLYLKMRDYDVKNTLYFEWTWIIEGSMLLRIFLVIKEMFLLLGIYWFGRWLRYTSENIIVHHFIRRKLSTTHHLAFLVTDHHESIPNTLEIPWFNYANTQKWKRKLLTNNFLYFDVATQRISRWIRRMQA